jgi:hypothetical protein
MGRLTSLAFASLAVVVAVLGTTLHSRYPDRTTLSSVGRNTAPLVGLPESSLLMSPPSMLYVSMIAATTTTNQISLMLKPVLVELGAVLLVQAVGLPVIAKLAFAARKIRWLQVSRNLRLSGSAIKRLSAAWRSSTRVWSTLGHVYKKTSASKVVRETKRLVKVFAHHHEYGTVDQVSTTNEATVSQELKYPQPLE